MTILCYHRPWLKKYFEAICYKAFPDEEIIFFSDFRKQDNSGFAEDFYRIFEQKIETELPPYVDKNQCAEIIKRCRLLRNLSSEVAENLIVAMSWAVQSLIEKYEPRLLVSVMVDSYVLDLLERCLKYNDKFFCGLVPVFVNGYFRITSNGELNRLRHPEEQEVNLALASILEENYKPTYLESHESFFAYSKRNIRQSIKSIYFPLIRYFSGDSLNYHYWSTQLLAMQRTTHSYFKYKSLLCLNWLQIVNQSDKKKIFLPLQYYPEATIDYWVDDVDMIDYENKLPELVRKLSKSNLVIIKEHPAFVGFRAAKFYSDILSNKNVVLIPSKVPTNFVIEQCDIVGIWTGTVGFEAAIRGKPVISITKPYFSSNDWIKHVNSLDAFCKAVDEISLLKKEPITYSNQASMVRYVLEGSLVGKMIYKTELNEPETQKSIENIASSLQTYLSHL